MNEMEESKISVIIPIYNGERYLHDCFESIKKQTYSNLEIILGFHIAEILELIKQLESILYLLIVMILSRKKL